MSQASIIIDQTNQISQAYQQYVSKLGAIGAEDLVRLYDNIKENYRLVWKMQCAIIYEYHKRSERAGDAIRDLMKDFGLKKTQLYSDKKLYEVFFKDNNDEFELEEKSWYVTALSAEEPLDALQWAETQKLAGNNLSIREFRAYIKQEKSDKAPDFATKRLLAAKELDDESVIDDANLRVFEPWGWKLKVRYADQQKQVPVYLYFDEFNKE
jgi:hypothetical protein